VRLLLIGLVTGVVPGLAATAFAAQPPGGALSALAPFVILATFISAAMAYGRLLPLLPAAAVDDPIGVQECWQLTAGNGLRLFLIGVLPILPLAVMAIAVTQLLDWMAAGVALADTLSAAFVSALVEHAINYTGIAVAVSGISIAYQELRRSGTVPVAT
jgi:hypothetical protein